MGRIKLQILKSDTQIKIVIGPAVSVVDGFTPITTLALSTADNAELLKHDAASTTDISGNTFAAITGVDGYYNLTITAAQLDTEGMLTIAINDTSLCYPIKHEFMVVNANVYDSLYSAASTDYLQTDVTQISANATAADNLQSQYDGTGLAGDTYPATQAQLGSISNTGSALNIASESYILTIGTLSSGLYSDTAALDSVYHIHTDSAGALDLYYQFDIAAGSPASAVITGYLNGSNDTLGIFAYNWAGASWDQVGSWVGSNSSTEVVNSYTLFASHLGYGANLGKIRIRFYAASGLTTATLAVDQIYIAYSQNQSGYDTGAIWIDTNLSNTNTVPGIDGVATNPVSSMTAANTLSSELNINRFRLSPSSTITFTTSQNDQIFEGHGYTLALGGQDINNTHILDAIVSGVATAATEMEFHRTEISILSTQNGHFYRCGFSDTVTMTLAGDYNYIDCYSLVAGASAPVFTKTAGQTITAQWRRWSGGITISGLESGDIVSIEGTFGTITLNGADATVEIRGTYKALTNNLTGTPSVNYDGAISGLVLENVAALLDDPRTEPGQGNLPVNPDMATKIDYLYKFLRNKTTSNGTTINVYDDAGTTVDHKSTHSDDATTYTRGEFVTGP